MPLKPKRGKIGYFEDRTNRRVLRQENLQPLNNTFVARDQIDIITQKKEEKYV